MKNYLKLLRFVKPHLWLFFIAFICTSVSAALNGITIVSILPILDIVLTQKQIVLPETAPAMFQHIVDAVNGMDQTFLFKIILSAIVPLFILKGLFFWLQGYLMNAVAYRTVCGVRNQLFEKLQRLSLHFYAKKRTGELMSRIVNDVGYINNAISFAFRDLVHEVLRIVIYTYLVIAIGGKISLITLILIPLIVWPALRIGKKLKKLSTRAQEKMADINSLLAETISGIRIVKAFTMEDYEIKRFNAHNAEFFRYLLKTAKRSLLSAPISEISGAIAATVIILLWHNEVLRGTISFGVFGMVVGSLMSLMQPLKKLTGVHFITQTGLAASKRIYTILDEEILIKDVPNALGVSTFTEGIAFQNVSFKYEPNQDYVLKNVSARVSKGEFIAIVGASGAGKTTLVNLIPRFYDPQEGRICIDGANIKTFKVAALRSLVAIVSQETVIFNDTIANNISYGKKDAPAASIIDAARKAFAFDFINKLPAGFDTTVGDRGFTLSGGQKQRIAIARAFLKDAPILILDEATSNLDSESEKLIQEALYELTKGKTVFTIAHRLSTVQRASRILVIDSGSIVEEGTHQDLIKHGVIYKKLYQLQFNA